MGLSLNGQLRAHYTAKPHPHPHKATMKRIVLCADDYGQNSNISRAILQLADSGRLSATSCMSAATGWPTDAQQLRNSSADIDVGLHLTLINEPFLDPHALAGATTATTLNGLIIAAYLRKLNQDTIIQAFNIQLDRFYDGMGREPDFIDGHQHIHQLPVVRSALLAVYQQRFPHRRPYIRNLAHIQASGHAGLKPQIIRLLGARPLQRALHHHSLPHNQDFGGIYDFSPQQNYAALMHYWLQQAQDGALFMCHPGTHHHTTDDPIAAARTHEFHYLNSHAFTNACHHANVQLVRGHHTGWH